VVFPERTKYGLTIPGSEHGHSTIKYSIGAHESVEQISLVPQRSDPQKHGYVELGEDPFVTSQAPSTLLKLTLTDPVGVGLAQVVLASSPFVSSQSASYRMHVPNQTDSAEWRPMDKQCSYKVHSYAHKSRVWCSWENSLIAFPHWQLRPVCS